ncbi:MAG: GatB/YqeY domain-containing protein [Firmicutes bacterium]|nr:GatB/YqeY domain-containing protein [Bacillota bacterium]
MKAALKAGEEGKQTLSVVRLARAALQNATIEKRGPLTDEEAAVVLSREVKQRRETAEEYRRLGRPEAAERLLAEAAILEGYLPQQLTDEELRRIIGEAIQATGAASRRDAGKVMGKVMPQVRGRADGKRVSDMVQALLPPG